MDRGRFTRLQELFDQALERPEAERGPFIDEACAGDPDLGARVRRLLRTGDAGGDDAFMTSAVRAATLAIGDDDDRAGWQLGPYRLVRELGHGGMGSVWLAERVDDAYRARVAIKLVRGGFANPELERRFRAERQILADLNHAHIASLVDGGEAPDGTPYLVMEYIDGSPITTWAAQHRLPLGERLRLFRQVCDAVQHAHGSLVVHRDLKPSNVLVGADGTLKLVDFGIAKLLDVEGPSDVTMLAPRLTPGYASPEQLRGDRVTVATDVYSLGVLLYELVAGVHPFAADGPSTEEVRRRVLQLDAPRASDALKRQGAGSGVSARSVRGDLDNIIAKAMRKEPELRYASVAQLAEDVDRMLSGDPVLARPSSVGYRARKFAARHKAAVGAVTLLFLSLLAGLGATLWQARRAEAARSSAEAALSESNAVKDFLTNLFQASDPNENRGATITARELLQRGVERVDSLSGQPRLQADFLGVLASVEMSLGEYRRAEQLYGRELEVRGSLPGPVDSTTVRAIVGSGDAYDRLGFPDSAAAAYERAIDLGQRSGGLSQPTIIAAIDNLGNEYDRMGEDAKARASYRRAMQLQSRIYGPDDVRRARVMNDYGLTLAIEGRYREAEPLLRESLHLWQRADSGSLTTAEALDNLGMMLREDGRYDEAEPYLRHAFAIRLRVLGPDARFMAESYFSLGDLLALRGRPGDFAESDSLLHAALNVFRATLGPKHRAVGYAMHALGVLDLRRGDLAAAERWLRQALAIRETTTEDSPRETVRTLVRLGQVQLARREPDTEPTYERADSLARARLAPTDPVRERATVGLSLALARDGRRRVADTMYLHAMSALAARLGALHPLVEQDCAAGENEGLEAGTVCRRGAG